MKRKPRPMLHSLAPTEDEFNRRHASWLLRDERRRGKVIRINRTRYFLKSREFVLDCPKPPPAQPPFNLSMRLTHRFNQGWAGLDDWHSMGEARVIASGSQREDDESFRRLEIVEVKAKGYRPQNIMRALRETLSFSCQCEHDCCGHFFGGPIRIRPLSQGRYAVLTSGHRNC